MSKSPWPPGSGIVFALLVTAAVAAAIWFVPQWAGWVE